MDKEEVKKILTQKQESIHAEIDFKDPTGTIAPANQQRKLIIDFVDGGVIYACSDKRVVKRMVDLEHAFKKKNGEVIDSFFLPDPINKAIQIFPNETKQQIYRREMPKLKEVFHV